MVILGTSLSPPWAHKSTTALRGVTSVIDRARRSLSKIARPWTPRSTSVARTINRASAETPATPSVTFLPGLGLSLDGDRSHYGLVVPALDPDAGVMQQ